MLTTATTTPDRPLTHQQRAALEARDHSVSLAAGAGCGKTFVLTERFIAQLDPTAAAAAADLDQLIAITFTDAAAREMRDRIRTRCLERLQKANASNAALSTLDPFELTVPVAGVDERAKFGGQIDRIDVGRVGERTVFNVIDYKSTRSVIDQTKIEAGKQLQLALYSMAAAELLLAEQQATPLSASYWSVGGKGPGGFALGGRGARPLEFHQVRDGAVHPAPDWEKLRAAMINRIGELIADIRRGQFPVFNDDENCTNYCELRTICRIAQVRSLEKQWPPPEKG